jgi:phosphoglucomutase
VACILVCALAASCKLEGLNLAERLELLYKTYGYYQTQVVSVELDGEAGKRRCGEFIDSFRKNKPTALANTAVTRAADYLSGLETDLASGETRTLNFPSSNVLSFQLGNQGKIILRPSGTEPKLKIYYFAAAATKAEAQKYLAAFVEDMQHKMQDFGI